MKKLFETRQRELEEIALSGSKIPIGIIDRTNGIVYLHEITSAKTILEQEGLEEKQLQEAMREYFAIKDSIKQQGYVLYSIHNNQAHS